MSSFHKPLKWNASFAQSRAIFSPILTKLDPKTAMTVQRKNNRLNPHFFKIHLTKRRVCCIIIRLTRHRPISRVWRSTQAGRRGAPAKGVGRVTGARVRISPSPPEKKDTKRCPFFVRERFEPERQQRALRRATVFLFRNTSSTASRSPFPRWGRLAREGRGQAHLIELLTNKHGYVKMK